jgi:hypothetical protein
MCGRYVEGLKVTIVSLNLRAIHYGKTEAPEDLL